MNSAFCGDFIVYRRADNWHKGRYKNGCEEMSGGYRKKRQADAQRRGRKRDGKRGHSEEVSSLISGVRERFLPYFTCFLVRYFTSIPCRL